MFRQRMFLLLLLAVCLSMAGCDSPAGAALTDVQRHGLNVLDFTADGTVGKDADADTAAVQAALDASVAQKKNLFFPAGTYLINKTLKLDKVWGINYFGAGQEITRLTWDGPAGIPMVYTENCREAHWADMAFVGTKNRPSYLLQSHTPALDSPAPGLNTYNNITFLGGDIGVGFTSVENWQNDTAQFIHCIFSDATKAGFYNQHSNGKLHQFIQCNFFSSPYGIHFGDGNFQALDCYFGGAGMSEAAFWVEKNSDTIVINGCMAELQGARFFYQSGELGQLASPVEISGCRIWHWNKNRKYLDVIYQKTAGPLTVRSCKITGYPDVGNSPYIHAGHTTVGAALIVEGNHWKANGSDKTYPNVNLDQDKGWDVRIRGNTYHTAGGPGPAVPEGVPHSRLAAGRVILDEDEMPVRQGAETVALDGAYTVTSPSFKIPATLNGWTIFCKRNGPMTLTLPNSPANGFSIDIKDAGGKASRGKITIKGAGANTIQGAASKVINTNYGSLRLVFDGKMWFVL